MGAVNVLRPHCYPVFLFAFPFNILWQNAAPFVSKHGLQRLIVERKIYLDVVFYAFGHCGLTTYNSQITTSNFISILISNALR